MPACVYILRDLNNKLYIGSTADIDRRLRQHYVGHTQTTRNMVSPKPVFKQEFHSLHEARKIERKLKSWKRKDFIEKIIRDGHIKITSTPSSFNG